MHNYCHMQVFISNCLLKDSQIQELFRNFPLSRHQHAHAVYGGTFHKSVSQIKEKLQHNSFVLKLLLLQLFYSSLDFVLNCPWLLLQYYYYYYCNYSFTALWILSGTTRVSRYQKGKTKSNLDFLEQETVSGSGICLAICKSAPCRSLITTSPLSILQAGCPSCCSINSVKALKS